MRIKIIPLGFGQLTTLKLGAPIEAFSRGVLETHPKQKAIIVSGFSESDRVRAAKSLGAGAYVKKPYIPEKLGLAVRKELDRST